MNENLEFLMTARNQTAAQFDQLQKDLGRIKTQAGAASRALSVPVSPSGAFGTNSAYRMQGLAFQVNDIAMGLATGQRPMTVMLQQGAQLAQIYGPGSGGVGAALKDMSKLAMGAVRSAGPLGVVIGAAALATNDFKNEINEAQAQQVTFGDVAGGAWDVVSGAIAEASKDAMDWAGQWAGPIWDATKLGLGLIGNLIVGTFVGAFDSVVQLWDRLPMILGDAAISTANAVIGAVESMINGSIGLLNDLIEEANKLPLVDIDKFGSVAIDRFNNPYEGALGGALGQIGQSFSSAYSTDWIGQFMDAVKGAATARSAARDAADVAGGGTAANDNFRTFTQGLDQVKSSAEQAAEAIAGSLAGSVTSLWQAFRQGENVLEALGQQVGNLADQLMGSAIQSLFNSLLGVGGGLGSPIPLPQFGGSAPVLGGPSLTTYRFATGGSFRVGGSGGTDSQFVSFMATPGEMVDVRTPGQAANGNESDYLDVRVVSEVRNGNLVPVMTEVSGQVAGRMIRQQAPAAVRQAQRDGRRFG